MKTIIPRNSAPKRRRIEYQDKTATGVEMLAFRDKVLAAARADFLSIPRPLVARLGLHAAAYLADLINTASYYERSGVSEFYRTQDKFRANTGLGKEAQVAARNRLVNERLIEVHARGQGGAAHFTVRWDRLAEMFGREPAQRPACLGGNPPLYESEQLHESELTFSKLAPSGAGELSPRSDQDEWAGLQRAEDKRPAPIYDTSCPKEIKPLLDKWNAIAIPHRPGTKTLHDGIAALKGLLSGTFANGKPSFAAYRGRRFTVKEVALAMDRFALARASVEHAPADKTQLRRLSLPAFIFNARASRDKSWFIRCLEAAPRSLADNHPELTALVLRKYKEANFAQGKLDPETAARMAAKFARYWKRRRDWLRERYNPGIVWISEKTVVTTWFRFLDEAGRPWGAGHVLADGAERSFENWLKGE